MDCQLFEKHIYDYFTSLSFDWKLRKNMDIHYFGCESCFETYRVTKIIADKKTKSIVLDKLVGDKINGAITNFEKGKVDDGFKELKSGIFMNPHDAELRLQLLKIIFSLGEEYKEENLKNIAIAKLKNLQKAVPYNVKVGFVLAEFYFLMKEKKKAIEILKKVQKIDQDCFRFNFDYYKKFFEEWKTNIAIFLLDKVNKIESKDLLALQCLAWFFYVQRKYDKAIFYCNSYLKVDYYNTNILICRAKSYKGKKLYKKAISDCNHIIKVEPSITQAYNIKTIIFFKNNLIDEVIDESQKALSIIPNNTRANLNIGVAYFIKRESDLSFEILDKIPKNTFEFPIAAIFKSFINMERGNILEALINIEKYLGEYPNDAIATMYKGKYYEKIGRSKDALKFYKKSFVLIKKDDCLRTKYKKIIANFNKEVESIKAFKINKKTILPEVQFNFYDIKWISSILDKNEVISPMQFNPVQLKMLISE
jgi:tetratricopeptide (TPR) repeat protein